MMLHKDWRVPHLLIRFRMSPSFMVSNLLMRRTHPLAQLTAASAIKSATKRLESIYESPWVITIFSSKVSNLCFEVCFWLTLTARLSTWTAFLNNSRETHFICSSECLSERVYKAIYRPLDSRPNISFLYSDIRYSLESWPRAIKLNI